MANEFNFGNVSGATRAGYTAEEAALQGLNETPAIALAVAAGMADTTPNPLAVAEAEYLNLMNAAGDTLFTLKPEGGVALAMGAEAAVDDAIKLFANGSDFVSRKQIGIDNTDDDASLALDGEIVCNTSVELAGCLQARDANFVYFDWGVFVVPADVKESFAFLKAYQKKAIIDQCPAQTDTTGSVWTCTSQDAADQIVSAYIRRLKKSK